MGNVAFAATAQHFLGFRIAANPDTSICGMLSAHHLTEILTLSTEDMIPIPTTPAAVIGVYNWRGEVLWLVDLGCVLNLQPIVHRHHPFAKYSVIIVRHNMGILGLVVDQVDQLIELDSSEIQSLSKNSSLPLALPQIDWLCISGYWQTPQQDTRLEINLEALIQKLRA